MRRKVRAMVWNIFPRMVFGRVTEIPPLIGTRMVRMKIRYTDDPIRAFAKVSLMRLSVSGV